MFSNQGLPNIEVFDSLGLRRNRRIFNRYSPYKAIDINDFAVQDGNSNTCALFCIFYIINRFYNGNFNNIIKDFVERDRTAFVTFQRIWTSNSSWKHFLMKMIPAKMNKL